MKLVSRLLEMLSITFLQSILIDTLDKPTLPSHLWLPLIPLILLPEVVDNPCTKLYLHYVLSHLRRIYTPKQPCSLKMFASILHFTSPSTELLGHLPWSLLVIVVLRCSLVFFSLYCQVLASTKAVRLIPFELRCVD